MIIAEIIYYYLASIGYVLTAVCAMTVNGIVLITFCRSNTTRTVDNCYLLNLVVVDFLVGTASLSAILGLWNEVHMPLLTCALVHSLALLFPQISVCALTMTVMHRASRVARSKLFDGRAPACFMIVMCWLVGLAMALQPVWYSLRIKSQWTDNSTCGPRDVRIMPLHATYLLSVYTLTVFIVIAIAYFYMFFTVRARLKNELCDEECTSNPCEKGHDPRRRRAIRREVKSTWYMIVMVGSLAICWIPYVVVANMFYWSGNVFTFLLLLSNVIFHFNSVLNPMFYALLNPRFQSSMKTMCSAVHRNSISSLVFLEERDEDATTTSLPGWVPLFHVDSPPQSS